MDDEREIRKEAWAKIDDLVNKWHDESTRPWTQQDWQGAYHYATYLLGV